jgi:hypothetical protein
MDNPMELEIRLKAEVQAAGEAGLVWGQREQQDRDIRAATVLELLQIIQLLVAEVLGQQAATLLGERLVERAE